MWRSWWSTACITPGRQQHRGLCAEAGVQRHRHRRSAPRAARALRVDRVRPRPFAAGTLHGDRLQLERGGAGRRWAPDHESPGRSALDAGTVEEAKAIGVADSQAWEGRMNGFMLTP